MAGGLAAAEDMPGPVPVPRPRPHISPSQEPHSFREAAGPDFNSAAVTDQPTDCDQRLARIAVIAPIPRLIGPGACGGADMVRVDAVLLPDNKRIEIRPEPYLRCEMAESLAAWIRDEAAPHLDKAGVSLRRVETYDDFECRGRNRIVGTKISAHGKGNAIDLRAFTLADKRTIG
ncbi:MAG: extensin family protein, partial [Rhizobiales bacterium]|nr:extensin family protein [Hyphomicrobiales bacterium]